MKKTIIYSIATALLLFTACDKDSNNDNGNGIGSESSAFTADGATKSVFSVAEGRTVRFSRGNLENNAAQGSHTTADGQTLQGTWRFSIHQYDTIIYGNLNASPIYDGWQSDFSWGTSGWNSGAVCFQPWEWSHVGSFHDDKDYWPYGDSTASLSGSYKNADWAYYNAISNGGNRPCMWRTLTSDEWEYLISTRSASTINSIPNARFAPANVAGIDGVILFPDTYSHPSNIDLPQCINRCPSHIRDSMSYYTASQWNEIETRGGVFLPIHRSEQSTYGEYWSVTNKLEGMHAHPYYLYFIFYSVQSASFNIRVTTNGSFRIGRLVRPIQDVK